MYVTGVVGILILLFAVLMMVNVIPMTSLVVGGLFVAVCLGFAGPYVIRTP